MERLKIAIQKSGRLNEKSVEILKKSGLNFDNYKGSLISHATNFPLEILFLRDDDIPEYVMDGIADLGIVGENVIVEKQVQVSYLHKLGFGKCSLQIALPNGSSIRSLNDLNGKSIATSYPNILGKFLGNLGIRAEIRVLSGSVEIATNLGLSDAICDLVSTGGTLKSNGLFAFEGVMDSQAVLIGHPELKKISLVEEVQRRLASVLRAGETKYVVLNIPASKLEEILLLLPGIKSPTVVPLAAPEWVAVHTVIPENDFWDKINAVKAAGAEGIVVLPIEKIIT